MSEEPITDFVTTQDGTDFTNTHIGKAEVEFKALKELKSVGRTLKAGEFSFELLEGDEVIQTVSNSADGYAYFEKIEFLAKDAGIHSYTIREVPGDLAGMSYDDTEHHFSIEVIDNKNGTMDVEYMGYNPETGVKFVNTFTPSGSVVLEASKSLVGKDLVAGDYTFQVSDRQGNVYCTAENDASGNVVFPELTFHAAGTYVYEISEVVPEDTQELGGLTVANGVAYDTHKSEVTIVTLENEDGTLGITTTYAEGKAAFANKAVPDAVYPLAASKRIAGRDFRAGDAFTFTVTAAEEGAPLPANPSVTIEPTAGDEAAIDFGDITFTTADLGKTYTYTITEEGAGQTVDGLTYDPFSHWVKLTINDNGDGTMRVDAEQQLNAEGIVFTNTYVAEGQATLTAAKTLEGRDLKEGEFFFELRGDKLPGDVEVLHAHNAADGSIAFMPIGFTQDDAGKDFHYTITETQGTLRGVVYDDSSYDVTVHVTDNGDGTLGIAYDWGQAAEPPTFHNSLLTRTGFEFDKYSFGAEGAYDFVLTAVDASGNPREGVPVDYSNELLIADDGATAFTATVQNGAYESGRAKVAFPEITYAADGDYHYLVAEAESSVPGMAADEASYLVHVRVAGGVPETTYELLYGGQNLGETADLSFYNNSAVTVGGDSLTTQSAGELEQRVSVYPEAKKYLNGATDALVGGDFAFELVDEASGAVIASATNDEAGNVAFFDERNDPGLAYDAPGVHYYVMREVAGSEAGVAYDDSAILVTVTVTQSDQGLVADVAYNGPGGAEPAFYNVKEGMDVTVRKVSREGGEGLAGCTYALWMAGPAGDVMVAEAVSDAEGYITFRDVSLMSGQKYYFKEVEAPVGHTVDPHRTAYFTLNAAGDALVLAEQTAADGWHSATENAR